MEKDSIRGAFYECIERENEENTKPKTNFERIKSLNLNDMAKELTEFICRECGYVGLDFSDFHDCDIEDCWCHKSNKYRQTKEWLQRAYEVS